MDPPKTVLFFTSSEYGQANVVLSIALEVASNPRYKVHIAGFADFGVRVSKVNTNDNLTFHAVESSSLSDLMKRKNISSTQMCHSPTLLSAIRSFDVLQSLILGWEPSEYITSYYQCLKILEDVRPDALVLEIGIWQAHDAARTLGIDYVVVAPSTAKEMVHTTFPGNTMVTKWPFFGSGSQYPLSAMGYMKNIALTLGLVVSIIRTGHVSGINKARKEAGLSHAFPMTDMYRKDNLLLCPYLPQLDYDYPAPLPSNFIGCGPIVLPSQQSLDQADPDLATWLKQSPTVLINLGTHVSSDPSSAVQIAEGISSVLTERPDLQILWKLKYDWSNNKSLSAVVSTWVDTGRLRIVPWLELDPAQILLSGHVVCHVHHGGANAYFETCRAGIPHLILPCWWDTYEYGDRARYLGIGLIGNVGVAPGAEAGQFASKLLQVRDGKTVTEHGESMQARAEALGRYCRENGEGRVIAAEAVWRWADAGKSRVALNGVGKKVE